MNVATWKRRREHGDCASRRLDENEEYQVLHVEPLAAGVEKLRAGRHSRVARRGARKADVIVLAIADKFIKPVAADLVPKMRPAPCC